MLSMALRRGDRAGRPDAVPSQFRQRRFDRQRGRTVARLLLQHVKNEDIQHPWNRRIDL
jgi:hypothetical protein